MSDSELRRLERLAAQGDPDARMRLHLERARHGLPLLPDEVLGVRRGTSVHTDEDGFEHTREWIDPRSPMTELWYFPNGYGVSVEPSKTEEQIYELAACSVPHYGSYEEHCAQRESAADGLTDWDREVRLLQSRIAAAPGGIWHYMTVLRRTPYVWESTVGSVNIGTEWPIRPCEVPDVQDRLLIVMSWAPGSDRYGYDLPRWKPKRTMCGCAGCEGWNKVRDAWVDMASRAESAADEPPEPVVRCVRSGEPIPSWGPPLK